VHVRFARAEQGTTKLCFLPGGVTVGDRLYLMVLVRVIVNAGADMSTELFSMRSTIIAGACLSSLLIAFLVGRAFAGGIPSTGAMTYAGKLEEVNGAALTGTHMIEVKLHNSTAPGGTPVCTTGSRSTPLVSGRFSVVLPDECTAQIKANSDTAVEVVVDGSPLGITKLGAVPYAVEADRASSAAGALDSRIAALEQQVNGIPASVRVVARSVERTGAIMPKTASWTTIPGLATTIMLTQDSLVQLTSNGTQRTVDNAPQNTTCHVGYRYRIDGVSRGTDDWGERINVNASETSWHSTWTVIDFAMLGPGQHTVEFQAKNPDMGGGNCYVCAEANGDLAGFAGCTMNVVAIPQ
jgi:hypothetical protein